MITQETRSIFIVQARKRIRRNHREKTAHILTILENYLSYRFSPFFSVWLQANKKKGFQKSFNARKKIIIVVIKKQTLTVKSETEPPVGLICMKKIGIPSQQHPNRLQCLYSQSYSHHFTYTNSTNKLINSSM